MILSPKITYESKISARIKKSIPKMKMDITPNPSTKNPPIAILSAMPPFNILKNTQFASSGLSMRTDDSIYCMRL